MTYYKEYNSIFLSTLIFFDLKKLFLHYLLHFIDRIGLKNFIYFYTVNNFRTFTILQFKNSF